MNFTENNFIITTNTLETSSMSKRAACHNLFIEESPSPVNKSNITFNYTTIL
jgi:hypothetical protein